MLDSLREAGEFLFLGVAILSCVAAALFVLFVTFDFASAWFKDKRRVQDNTTEKRRRIYYQDIVYRVCNVLDKTGMFPEKTVCGVLETPSTQVEARVTSLYRGYKEMAAALDTLTNEVREMTTHVGNVDLRIRENVAREIERQNAMVNDMLTANLTDEGYPVRKIVDSVGRHDAFVRDICAMLRDPQRNWLNV